MIPVRIRTTVGGFQVEVSPTICPGVPPVVLVLEDGGDDLDEEDRAPLNAALETVIVRGLEGDGRTSSRSRVPLAVELRPVGTDGPALDANETWRLHS